MDALQIRVLALSFLAVITLNVPALAAISVEGNDSGTVVTVIAENAMVGEILKQLGERYDFAIEGVEFFKSAEPISTNLSGDLKEIVKRLLRNWNYVNVRSSERPAAGARVVMIDANFGSNASTPMLPPPPKPTNPLQ